MKQRTKNKITIGVFLSVVFGLTIFNLVTPDKAFSENENRPLAQNPAFTPTALFGGGYTQKFEAYTTDQFPAREQWVSLKVNTDLLMQKKDTNGVYFAEDDYLIERFSERDLNKQQIETNWNRVVNFANQSIEKLGSEHVRVMIAPTASGVMSDLLPPFAPNLNQEEVLNQMSGTLPDKTFVNVFSSLSEAGNNDKQVYYKTDHHWTTYGAFLAYQEWATSMGITPLEQDDFNVKAVSDEFYGTIYSKANNGHIVPDVMELYETKVPRQYELDFNMGERQGTELYNMDYLKKKDKYAMFLDGNNAFVSVKTDLDNDRKLLIVKDSYAHCFVPFASNHFNEIDVLDLRYYHQPVSELMEQNGYTDVLVLYNLNTFSGEKNLGVLDQ